MTTIHITWGPTVLHSTQPAGTRWCFGCRRRTEHDDQMWVDEKPGYYDPTVVRVCRQCGEDRTRFPGT